MNTNNTFGYDYEDSSSGYESSDAESVISLESRDSCYSTSRDSRNNPFPADDNAEVMNFQSTHALCEHMKMILSIPEMCDVTFLVGPQEVPVHGVRAIMGSRSRVFYQLILKHMSLKVADEEGNAKNYTKSKKGTYKRTVGIGRSLSQRLVIHVEKYDCNVFRMLVQFVHYGRVDITEDTVSGLFYAASQFEMCDLSKACLDFVERCLQVGRAEKLLFSTRRYSRRHATSTMFDKIYSALDRYYIAKLEGTPV